MSLLGTDFEDADTSCLIREVSQVLAAVRRVFLHWICRSSSLL